MRFKADINGDTMGVWIRPERIESIEQWDDEVCEVTLFSGKIYRIYGSMDSLSRKIDPPQSESPAISSLSFDSYKEYHKWYVDQIAPVIANTDGIFKDPDIDIGVGTIQTDPVGAL